MKTIKSALPPDSPGRAPETYQGTKVPVELANNWDRPEAYWWRKAVDQVVQAMAQPEGLSPITVQELRTTQAKLELAALQAEERQKTGQTMSGRLRYMKDAERFRARSTDYRRIIAWITGGPA